MIALTMGLLLCSSPEVHRFAVVVGENDPLDASLERLEYADDDAILSARLLRDAGVQTELLVRVDEDSRQLFAAEPSGQPPTKAALQQVLANTFAEIERHNQSGTVTEFIFFYSGHGDVEHGEGYVALEQGRMSRGFLLEEMLAKSPAKRNHIIIDACRSYFMVFNKGPGGRRSTLTGELGQVRKRFRNTGFILSTSSARESHEWARFRGGVFSHEIRSALRGSADLNLDGVITYAELGAFVEKANAEIPNSMYRPDAAILPPLAADTAQNAELLAWSPERAVEVPAQLELGHLYVEDAEGIRMADAHPDSDQALALHLGGSRPLFFRSETHRVETVLSTSTPTLAQAQLVPSKVNARGAAHLAFRRLFVTPLTRADVAAFRSDGVWMQRATVTAEPELRYWTRRTAPWAALGTGLLGGGLTAAAYRERQDGTHATLDDTNGTISDLNTGAVVVYSVAGAALVFWITVELWTWLDQ